MANRVRTYSQKQTECPVFFFGWETVPCKLLCRMRRKSSTESCNGGSGLSSIKIWNLQLYSRFCCCFSAGKKFGLTFLPLIPHNFTNRPIFVKTSPTYFYSCSWYFKGHFLKLKYCRSKESGKCPIPRFLYGNYSTILNQMSIKCHLSKSFPRTTNVGESSSPVSTSNYGRCKCTHVCTRVREEGKSPTAAFAEKKTFFSV